MTEADLAVQARRLVEQSAFAEAEALIQSGLGNQPRSVSDNEILYILAVAQRYLKKFDAARETLATIIELDSRNARAYQELGHLQLASGNPTAALDAFEQAVNLNPALVGSWRVLVAQHPDPRLRQAGKDQLDYLESLPPALVSVNSLISEGRFARADEICRQFLRGNKQHVEGMRLLAAIGERLEVLMDAEFLLETCLELEPEFTRARYDYANLLLKMQKFASAYTETGKLLAEQPDNLAFQSLHANAAAGVGHHEEAIDGYNAVLASSPAQNSLLVMRGHAEKTIGRIDDAIASYRDAYTIQPGYGDAWWSLANTKTYRFTDEELDLMRREEARPEATTEDRVHLCFALGKALEDRGEYAESFACYERGNALQLAALTTRPAAPEQRVEAQVATCTPAFFSDRASVGHPAPDPIFIVGLPRAGSTLLEQILASHSEVDGTMELPNIISLAQRLRNSQPGDRDDEPVYPRILAELDHSYFQRFGEQFISDTRIYREDAPLFIDKNPNNFFHIGLIRLILPNAKIIDARRHPMSCCFSGFKQLFGQGQEFSYGLKEIGTYYREYVRLMEHWDEVLPGFVLRVQHEDVLSDLEGQVRRLLDFCGLPFEQSCIEYYKTERSVRTPSSEQVRQPIFTSATEDWRHFEPWLDPLKEALGPAIRNQYDL